MPRNVGMDTERIKRIDAKPRSLIKVREDMLEKFLLS